MHVELRRQEIDSSAWSKKCRDERVPTKKLPPSKAAPKPRSQDSPSKGGETHQSSGGGVALTTNQGLALSDNQNSLKGGGRGPALLEDFILREKITHFDHERIPERIVHARGSAAHGYFQPYKSMKHLTSAAFLADPKVRTPVFVRFSTVAGGAGSVDLPRDVRGFAVKFYTQQGNFDLVGNNIPVFFIQDAIKFPDLIHAVKMEADRGYPQSATAHDTFWDFISLMPESLHMIMWAMSDRTIPRSLRMMEGFGVNTYRLVDAEGKSNFVKFHWRPLLGTAAVLWEEAVRICGADQDYHRRDLFEAIQKGDYPEFEFGIQVVSQEAADKLPFDILDATKLVPEEVIPVEIIGKMVLDRNPDNFFAETEQVAFCPSHIVPGIDFSEDPLLQGRLFSYLDTQLSRLGSPNFHELPINRPKCPFANLQRDAKMQMTVPTGRANYEPNSIDPNGPREVAAGFHSAPIPVKAFPLFERLKSEMPDFAELTAFQAGPSRVGVRRKGAEAAANPLRSEYVTGTYFSTFGVGALGGRVFTAADDVTGAPPVVVLSHNAWQIIYGGESSVVGSTVFIEGHPFTVIGVAPPGFFGDTLRSDPPDIWIPLHQEPVIAGESSKLHESIPAWLRVIGRLGPGGSVRGMAPHLTGVLQQWMRNDAGYPANWMPDIIRTLPKQVIDVVPAGAGVGAMKEQYGRSLRGFFWLSARWFC
jgi:catalase